MCSLFMLVVRPLVSLGCPGISKAVSPQGFEESRAAAREGGAIAGRARQEIEVRTGSKVVSPANAKTTEALDTKVDTKEEG